MKLTLTNFRCYGSKVFELPDDGIVLIHGTSGAGKSSLLKAISYVLYGKEKRVVKYKETKCTVVMEHKNFKITRTNKPSALVTLNIDNDCYTGDVAQENINKIYGDPSYFNITSYVAQKSIESFINLSGSSKIEFFNSLALKDTDICSFREKTREQIKLRKQLVNNKTNEIKILKSQLENFVLPADVEYPLRSGRYDITEVEKERKMWKNNTEKLDKLTKEYKDLSNKENSLLERRQKYETNKTKLDTYTNELDKYKNELLNISSINYEDYNILLDIAINIKTYLDVYLTYENKRKDYDNYIKSLLLSYKNELNQTEISLQELNFNKDEYDILYKLYTNKDMYKEIINLLLSLNITDFTDINTFISDKNPFKIQVYNQEKEISEFNFQNNEYDKEINRLQKDKCIKCPGCKTGLLLIDNSLVIHNTEKNKAQIDLLQSKIQSNREKINALLKTKDDNIIKSNIWDKLHYKLLQNKKDYLYFINKSNLKFNTYTEDLFLTIDKEYADISNKKSNYTKLMNTKDNLVNCIYKVENKEEKTIELKRKELSALKNDLSILKNKRNSTMQRSTNNILKILNSIIVENDEEFEPLNNLDEIDEYEEAEMLDIFVQVLSKLTKIISNNEAEYKNYDKIKQNIDHYTKEIGNLSCDTFDYTEIDNITNRKKELDEDINTREKKKKIYEKRTRQLETYLAFYNEISRYNKLKSDIDICEKEEKIYIKSLSVAENFDKLLSEAETISISNTLENINMSIRFYMSRFFPEGNMQMELSPFKENKKGDKTTGLDIDIYYNGERTGLENLSGGEFDRVLLVLFLSFNSMSKGDIIMLDECLSSLNSELVEEIIEIIKATLTGKLILVTLHQANVGIFDNFIEL